MSTQKYSPEEQQQICQTIISQLGGNQFFSMTGTKCKYYEETNGNVSVTFQLKRNALKAKYMNITLRNDLYDIEFFSVNKDFDRITKYSLEGAYCNMLRPVFEQQTQLRTSLTHIYG